VGTPADSIRFGAALPATGWYGIRFVNTAASNDSSLLQYCVLADGRADGAAALGTGGALLVDGFAKLRVSRSTLVGNTAHYGGAIYLANQAHITVQDCRLLENEAFGSTQTDGLGGAVYASNSSPRLIGNLFSSNAAVTAGAICLRTSAALVQGNTIVDNRATGIMA